MANKAEDALKKLANTPPWDWPADAGERIIATLEDAGARLELRLLAAELGGEFPAMDDAMAQGLLRLLVAAEEPAELRGQAAIALGPVIEYADTEGFDDPDDIIIPEETFAAIQSTLHRLHNAVDQPVEVRRSALEASARAPRDWHRPAIREAYASPEAPWNQTAVFCMRFVRGFDEAIIESLASDDAVTHAQAILAAGSWQIENAWRHVAGLLASDETPRTLLLAAIEAAPALNPLEALDLIEPFLEDEDEEVLDTAQDAASLAHSLLGDVESELEDDGGETVH